MGENKEDKTTNIRKISRSEQTTDETTTTINRTQQHYPIISQQ